MYLFVTITTDKNLCQKESIMSMSLVAAPTYFKFKELTKGDILINEGTYQGTKEGRFGPQHFFEEVEDGERKCLNSSGQLNYLVEEHLVVGKKCKIAYAGKILLEKGAMAGKEAHQFDLYTDNTAPIIEAPTTQVQTNMNLNDLE